MDQDNLKERKNKERSSAHTIHTEHVCWYSVLRLCTLLFDLCSLYTPSKRTLTLTWPLPVQYPQCLPMADAMWKPFHLFKQKWYSPLWVTFKDLSNLDKLLIVMWCLFSLFTIINKLECLLHFPSNSDFRAIYITFLLLIYTFNSVSELFFSNFCICVS